jgi:hypothetical protein
MKKSEVIFVDTLGIMSISETNNRTYIRLTSQSTTNHAPSNRIRSLQEAQTPA